MKNIEVCIQNLAMYNQGKLDFKWITLPCEDDEITIALKCIGVDSENDEYSIVDTNGIKVNEFENIFKVNRKVRAFMELSETHNISLKTICKIAEDFDYDEIEEKLEDSISINTKENGMENMTNDFEIVGYTIATLNGLFDKLEDMDIIDYFKFEEYGETYIINQGLSLYEDEENNMLILI